MIPFLARRSGASGKHALVRWNISKPDGGRRQRYWSTHNRAWKSMRTTATRTATRHRHYSSSSVAPQASLRPQQQHEEDRPPPALSKVLVANRGEIACRVIRTCRQWGIPTVAIYSKADGPSALHAQMADEAYLIGTGPTPAESYLRQDEILDLAQRVGVHAIHPGYGFLSENATFAQRIQQINQSSVNNTNGLVFIGPPPSAIHAMGSKSEAKAIVDKAGVPTTPGFYDTTTPADEPQNVDQLRQRAVDIGFPVLIKAVLGGGGKGMRLVWKESDFESSLESCQREAAAAFGNNHVLLEKYLVRPRHVEVQIVADAHDHVVSLYERDCSLQRRHQKIIEEAPAWDLPMAVRQELGAMARRAAQAVGYVNAGTVEFLLDTSTVQSCLSSSSSNDDNDTTQMPSFYFCEMNTRLQVEHPITEAITGIDLVEWQLRVAAGEVLPIVESEDIACVGHAFEARIYAEQPTRHFLPATGHVWHHAPPIGTTTNTNTTASATTTTTTPPVRVDTSIQTGHDVSVYYDPMISKLIVHGPTRTQALNRLIQALRQYEIAGVPTNIDFLIQCAQHPTFAQAGAVTTGFLDDFGSDLKLDPIQWEHEQLAPPLGQAVGTYAALLYLEQRRNTVNGTNEGSSNHPWSSSRGSWRLGGKAGRARRILERISSTGQEDGGGNEIECLSNPDGSFDIQVGPTKGGDKEDDSPQQFHITGGFVDDTGYDMTVIIDGSQTIHLTCVLREEKGHILIHMWPKNLPSDYAWEIRLENPYAPEAVARMTSRLGDSAGTSTTLATSGLVKAPMPGKIGRILHDTGSPVTKGDTVLVMEAMKMEHAIKATMDGTLEQVYHKVGDVVGADEVLFELGAGQ